MKNPAPYSYNGRLFFDKGRLDEESNAYILIKDAVMKN